MSEVIKRVTSVGGGSAGWLAAGVLASRFKPMSEGGIEVTVIESPDVNIIGVGEGTWPSMRSTLQAIGVSETDFIRECDVSFKQGSYFKNWRNGSDEYYHPFSPPGDFSQINLVEPWQSLNGSPSFADMVSPQIEVCRQNKAPKQITTPEYAFILNYGYHLNAGKFGEFLKKHCTEVLGVQYLCDHVNGVNSAEDGSIASLVTKNHGNHCADLYIDCTGFSSILLGQHYGIEFNDVRHVLFNDTALAVQVVYEDAEQAISSQTSATAQSAGWVWDIALPHRRGCGYVYSSAHVDDETAHRELLDYLSLSIDRTVAESLSFRKIPINSGYRKQFWTKNCLAIGLSAGFVEPLEASALVLVEMSAKYLADEFPATKEVMPLVAKRFNQKLESHWHQIIDFLKLHYCLTDRSASDYWIDNKKPESLTQSLLESLSLWQYRPPWHMDAPMIDALFPSASYQYVLSGMGFISQTQTVAKRGTDTQQQAAQRIFSEVHQKRKKLLAALPTNRDLLDRVKQHGLQTV